MNNKTLLIIVIALVLVFIPIGVYIFQFSERPLSSNPADWAQFGDYVGGLLNPILSAAAFFLLLVTISQNDKALKQNDLALKHNAEELALTREELRNAAQAQIQQAEIDQTNLNDRRLSESEQRFLDTIETLSNEVIGITERKYMKLAENHTAVSLRELITKADYSKYIVIAMPTNRSGKLELQKYFFYLLGKLKSLILEIESGTGLETHPNKDQIIKRTIARKGQYIKRIIDVLKTLEVENLTNSNLPQEILYLDNDPECKIFIEELELLISF